MAEEILCLAKNSLEDTDTNDDTELLQSIPGIGSITSKNFIVFSLIR